MSPDTMKVARELYASKEHNVEAIAETIGVSRKTVYRHLTADPLKSSAESVVHS